MHLNNFAISSLFAASALAAPSASTKKACEEISKSIPGRVSLPFTINFNTESSSYWSTALREIKPACVVTAKSAKDVSTAVTILNKYPDVKFAAKSGGHDPNPTHATAGNGVLISLNEMVGATYDSEKKVAYVKPGGEWNDVISALNKDGVAVVGGRLGLVGVGGLLTQGGISFLSAQYGLAADNIVSWEMVNANGTIVTIDAKAQPELAVALRGSGSQFGIVTQFTIRAYPIGKVWGGIRMYDESKTDEIYEAMHRFIPYNSKDPKAAIIVTNLILTGSTRPNLLFYFYDGEKPPTSGPFADLLKIKSTYDSTKIQSYPDLLKSNGVGVSLLNSRISFRTATIPYFPGNSTVYAEITNKWRAITRAYFKGIRGLASQCSVDYQPLPSAIGKQTEKRGGNAIGFTANDPDRVLLEIQCGWVEKRFDDEVRQFSKDLTSWIEDKIPQWLEEHGMSQDPYLPLFMNDAMVDQNVTGTYKDYAKFKALQLEADPEGVLRERLGGFNFIGCLATSHLYAQSTYAMFYTYLLEKGAILSLIGVALYLAHRAIRPKPLAGIPYNKDAAGKLLGDLPEMIGYCWLTSLTTRHQSPIVQVFTKPGGLPWVVIADPYESQDILLRRIKDFDRCDFIAQFVGGIMPYQHSPYLSTDAQFKNNRKLINQLMAPTFINEISAPNVYSSTLSLIKLWKLKCKLASGRPFSAHHDTIFASLDSIFASAFGLAEEDSNTFQRLKTIGESNPEIPDDLDKPVIFPEHSSPQIFSAIITLADSVAYTQLSPVPALTSWIIRKFPYMRNAKAIKDQFIRNQVRDGIRLIEDGSTTQPKSAIHSVLLREREIATKEGRQPEYYSPAIADEFLGFITGGYDTSATTIAWGLKILTSNPSVQKKLRDKLQEAFPDVARDARSLTYQELSSANIPYLDAVVDEVLRYGNPVGFLARQAQCDTTVLGHHIPRGTNVWIMANGPGYLEPNLMMDDTQRSLGARRDSKSTLTGIWDDKDISKFKPERWLERDPDTESERYNSMAGPSLPFGMGPRGCFGKRLALQVLRIHFALIVWHFELLPTPVELSSFDAVQKFAREPTQCYIRLKEVDF
ncbi:hypothetical protein F53441_2027 [Fusarium austroafricanum]|uniref:FAD-binding PCMH-type domain-containing protein n=1 Tax=Fusarium austroafricanum TaxID=2364996 RepID=A0A8H4KQQ6_9HYPO|nr:hypothetical protein F53441_2027 [Fusarium austroafricanum]